MPGWKPLIVCDGVEVPCTYAKLVELVNVLIFDLVLLSTFLAVIVFVWVGFLLMTSGGSEAKKKQATDMLWKVVWGFVWILAAWLVVYTITSVLLKPDADYTLLGEPRQN